MIEAVIVSTARTPIGKAYRGALNNTEGPTMAGHVIGEAVRRARVEPGEVEDVVMGCAMQQGTTAMNIARKGAIRAGSSSASAAPHPPFRTTVSVTSSFRSRLRWPSSIRQPIRSAAP